MSTRSIDLPKQAAALVAIGGALIAGVVGAAMAARFPVGLALLVACCYAPIVALRLDLAIAFWAPLVFLEGVPALNAASKVAGLLLAAVWLSANAAGVRNSVVLWRHRKLFWMLAALVVWLSLSALWAQDTGQVLADAWHWWAIAILVLMVATSLRTVDSIQLVITGLLIGAVISVLVGLADGDLSRTAVAGAADRLKSGAGDPNVLAAGLVAAAVLAAALMVPLRKPIFRWMLVVAIVILCAGLVASESRGGTLAAVATAIASFIFFRRRRAQVAGTVLLATGALVVSFAMIPFAWHRVSSYDDGGNGRTEVWTVAWRMTEAHPIAGVGLNNFGTDAGDYVLAPGSLKRVRLLVDHPTVVHNIYLQLLAETGIVGLLLFLTVATGCLRAAWLAGRRFSARADPIGETLACAVLVAGISILAAGFFISAGVDTRMWILFALGPALLYTAEPTLGVHRDT
jgi:O-antigen ligase